VIPIWYQDNKDVYEASSFKLFCRPWLWRIPWSYHSYAI